MEILKITSRQNEAVKQFCAVARNPESRRQTGQFAVEGARLCADAAKSGMALKSVFFTLRAQEKYPSYLETLIQKAQLCYEIAEPVAEKMRDVKSPQGIFCLCEARKTEPVSRMKPGSRYLAAEHLQDPSNLGAIMRSAEALGIDGLLISSDCCDPYASKALRASMGAAFRLPVYETAAFPETLQSLRERGFATYAAVVDPAAQSVLEADFSQGAVLAVGNEGNGLSAEAIAACHPITIPMRGRAESLNAAAAAMILMWEMMRR